MRGRVLVTRPRAVATATGSAFHGRLEPRRDRRGVRDGGADDDGEGFSQGAIKAVLSQLIESEDSSKPYSDETLVKLLKQRGIEIARRTVAKYRESLDIPPAHKRKFTE